MTPLDSSPVLSVFAVNLTGARYDDLINPGGESDNPDWDGIWQAAVARTASGWSVEQYAFRF
jgi:hypothetical protein